MSNIVIPFYFGLASRYSYLASTQLDRIESETGCAFEWLPLATGTLISRANGGRNPFHENPGSGQYDWAFREQDALAWAAYYGVPFREPATFRTDPVDLSKACWFADRSGLLKPMCRRIFQAIFVESRIVDRPLLAEMAAELGLDAAMMIEALDSPDLIEKHEQVIERALSDGAFGSPTFIVNGTLFWGNDRLPLVRHAIESLA
ncbi:MAG: 2-hydroxychromene-2-carboxylate isomerase [Alphaproteobacteria bacterium]